MDPRQNTEGVGLVMRMNQWLYIMLDGFGNLYVEPLSSHTLVAESYRLFLTEAKDILRGLMIVALGEMVDDRQFVHSISSKKWLGEAGGELLLLIERLVPEFYRSREVADCNSILILLRKAVRAKHLGKIKLKDKTTLRFRAQKVLGTLKHNLPRYKSFPSGRIPEIYEHYLDGYAVKESKRQTVRREKRVRKKK